MKWKILKEIDKEKYLDEEEIATKRLYENINVEDAFKVFFESRRRMVDDGELELSTYEDYLERQKYQNAKYENLIFSLKGCYDIVKDNRSQLYPVEEMAEQEAIDKAAAEAAEDNEANKQQGPIDII